VLGTHSNTPTTSARRVDGATNKLKLLTWSTTTTHLLRQFPRKLRERKEEVCAHDRKFRAFKWYNKEQPAIKWP
jgi:hypothetical protein